MIRASTPKVLAIFIIVLLWTSGECAVAPKLISLSDFVQENIWKREHPARKRFAREPSEPNVRRKLPRMDTQAGANHP